MMKPKATLTVAVALGLTVIAAAIAPARQTQESRTLLGFSAAARERQLAAEKKLHAAISATRLSELHRMVTARPHVAGTPGGKAVADAIAEKLRGFGLNVEMDAHSVHLSYAKRVRVTLLSPARKEIAVTEPALAPDEVAGSNAELTPGFVAYSASGKVSGPAVYVNYGLPGDYDALRAAGVDVKGAIVIARYGRVHRAVKVFNAEQRGARGIVIYSDPADDGAAKGKEWPEGMWRHREFIQRGNAKYSWYYHGDPLTPGYACEADCVTHSLEKVPTLPKIPVVAISAAAAEPILRALRGRVDATHAGPNLFLLRSGPGPAEVELDVDMDNGPRPIYNVLGRITGSVQPDRWVILGTHHDAWTYGGVDPGSACAVLLELARVLGEMRKTGWKPQRTIIFAFWDAEEYGLIGSTEFAERYAKELRAKAVAYINSDLYMAGGLRAGGTASLRDFVAEVARDVASPSGDESVYAKWRADESKRSRLPPEIPRRMPFEVELDPLGSGADFVPFQTHLGLPALSLEFGGESYGSYGVYHSNYDTRWFMEKFGDPGWRYGPALVKVLGLTVTRLASADMLPYRYSHLAEKLNEYLLRLELENREPTGAPRIPQLALGALRAELAAFQKAAQDTEQAAADRNRAGGLSAEAQRRLNDILSGIEKNFVVEDPPRANTGKDPRWYRHTIYGWNIYALYAGQTLPALHRALETNDPGSFEAERVRLERALAAATAELKAARAELR